MSNIVPSQMIDQITKTLHENACADIVFGAPIEKKDITIIPVATVKISSGGGGGKGKGPIRNEKDPQNTTGEGNGLGFGISLKTRPIGYIRIQNGEAIFIDIIDKSKIAMTAIIAGSFLGVRLLKWILRKKKK